MLPKLIVVGVLHLVEITCSVVETGKIECSGILDDLVHVLGDKDKVGVVSTP
jgi:hypothetical protein